MSVPTSKPSLLCRCCQSAQLSTATLACQGYLQQEWCCTCPKVPAQRTPQRSLPVVDVGYRHGRWQVVDRLPYGGPVWARTWLGVVWVLSSRLSPALIGNGHRHLPDVLVRDR